MNPAIPEVSWENYFPIVGHLKSIWYLLRCKWDIAAEEFKRATHNAGVAIFGVTGGIIYGAQGSVAGGIIGGICVDKFIFCVTGNSYGYTSYSKKWWNENMEEDDWFELLQLIIKDESIGHTTYLPFMIVKFLLCYLLCTPQLDYHRLTQELEQAKRWLLNKCCAIWNSSRVCEITQHEQGHALRIECNSDACKKPDFRQKDYDSKDVMLQKLKQTFNVLPIGKKVRLDNISQLQPGDHIIYHRKHIKEFHLYEHHAIVGEVFLEDGKYTAYEQASQNVRAIGKASIQENNKEFDGTPLYKIDYGDAGTPKGEVKKRAHFICHHANSKNYPDFDKTYNVFNSNCEHFANFCATGICKSYQIDTGFTPKIKALVDIWYMYKPETKTNPFSGFC